MTCIHEPSLVRAVLRSGILSFQGSVNGTTFVHELPLASVANGRHCGMVICADQWHFVLHETTCIHKLPLANVANSRHCGMVNSTDWWHFAVSGECNVERHAPASCCVLPAVPDGTDRRCPGHLVCPTHTGPRKAVRLAVQKQLLPHQSEWLVLIFSSPLPVSFHTPLSKLFPLLPPPPPVLPQYPHGDAVQTPHPYIPHPSIYTSVQHQAPPYCAAAATTPSPTHPFTHRVVSSKHPTPPLALLSQCCGCNIPQTSPVTTK